MYKTAKFTIKELVHPQILSAIGETNSWMRLDADCLRDLDIVRLAWGSSIYINDYPYGKPNDSRGLRPPNDPDGSTYSSHKMGVAFDLVPTNGKHQEFWDFCKKLIEDGRLSAFNVMEDRSFTPTWTHLAKMNITGDLYIIKP